MVIGGYILMVHYNTVVTVMVWIPMSFLIVHYVLTGGMLDVNWIGTGC